MRINVEQEHERNHWAKKFGVAREEVREAVQAAGPMVPRQRAGRARLRALMGALGIATPKQRAMRAAARAIGLTSPNSAKRRRRKSALRVRIIDARREYYR